MVTTGQRLLLRTYIRYTYTLLLVLHIGILIYAGRSTLQLIGFFSDRESSVVYRKLSKVSAGNSGHPITTDTLRTFGYASRPSQSIGIHLVACMQH